EPSHQSPVTFNQVIGEIPGQRDPEGRTDEEPGAPPQCTHYDHDEKGARAAGAVNDRVACNRRYFRAALSPQHRAAGEYRRCTELLLDPDQLVVFGEPIGP